MAISGVVEVRLLLGVCTVLQALLLMAGDVETNPGPTGKEGIYKLHFSTSAKWYSLAGQTLACETSKVATLRYVLLVGNYVTQSDPDHKFNR